MDKGLSTPEDGTAKLICDPAVRAILADIKKSTNWRLQEALQTRLRRDRWLNGWLE